MIIIVIFLNLLSCWLEFLDDLHHHSIGNTVTEQHPPENKRTTSLEQAHVQARNSAVHKESIHMLT